MKAWFDDNAATVWSWAALLAAAVIVFAASFRTSVHQFGIGFLTAVIALLVLLLIFEAVWRGVAVWGGSPGDEAKGGPPKRRRHR